MTFPKTIEHSKQYLVNIQLFGDRFRFTNPLELNYLVSSFEINHSGGSEFINQKGRNIASVFAKQPTVSVKVRCLMTEPDFASIISNVITDQQQILLSIGKIENENFNEISALIFEGIGYMDNAQIIASNGEFVTVEFVVNLDDINRNNEDETLPEFSYKISDF